MAEYILSLRSRKDLTDIGNYTVRTWSEEQAERYLRMLLGEFAVLAENPALGRPSDEIRSGLCSRHCGKHVIFYRQLGKNKIRIVRILHEKMDYPRHL